MSDQLKYEGLVALMLGVEERIEKRSKDRHDEFKDFVDHRFTKLDEHNKKQNGAIFKIENRVLDLEIEQKKDNKYVRFLKWVDTHPRRSIIAILGSWTILTVMVSNAVAHNWLPKLWELVIKVIT